MLQIRQATPNDVSALLPLVAAYWDFEDTPGFESLKVGSGLAGLLSAPSLGAGWIALMEGDPVGYLLAVYVFSLEHFGLTAEIDELFVAPPARAAGVGSQLLVTAEAEFIRVGCTHVSLQLSRANDAARRFYHRHGFGERSGYELLDRILPAG